MTLFESIVVAIVEGLTEFLPISSTGHMVIASSLLGINKNEFTKVFEVAIQLGAILAVVVIYHKKFFEFKNWQFYGKLMAGVLPALVAGFLFGDKIDELLESPKTVAISLLVGGVVLFLIDKFFPQNEKEPEDMLAAVTTKKEVIEEEQHLTFFKSIIIGCWQVLAMIPGVSRSAASIIGGMQQKLSRNFAAEFSFFLAVPTMVAATGYSLFVKKWGTEDNVRRGYELILENKQTITAFVVGNVVAFAVALVAIKFFIAALQKYGFKWWGIYRMVAGLIILGLIYGGYITS